MKVLILILMVCFKVTMTCACSCVSNGDTVEQIYDDSDGIYYVAVTAINIQDEQESISNKSTVKLDLDLKIFYTFKGSDTGVIKGHAFGRLPYKDKNGELGEDESSCDLKIGFGDKFLISKFGDGNIQLTMCSENILDTQDWKKLELLKKQHKL